MDEDHFYLPDECWEHVFKFLMLKIDNNSDHYHQFLRYRKLESLSLVSKQFLSITNRLRLSISIDIVLYREFAFPARIFQRFTNLTSLELKRDYWYSHICSSYIDKFLCRLSGFSLDNPKALNLSYKQLQAFPQITSLTCFRFNFRKNNTSMFLIAHCFPNLQLLYLKHCDVREEGIARVLNRCCNIRNLYLVHCSGVKLHGFKFKAPKLEVLNLSYTMVDDETLCVISKSCRGLLELNLQGCLSVTEKGVKHVVENCTQLRTVNLRGCAELHMDVLN